MSNTRMKYLFPNIENKRKLKWLENATFVSGAEDHEIVNLSLEEYLHRFRRENTSYNDNNKDITVEVNNEHYANWKKRSQNNIFSLDGSGIRFDKEIVLSLAQHLASHPLEMPSFLEQNAINIIGLFLGENILYTNMALAPSFGYTEYELCHSQKISEEDYRRSNFEAKYKLSLFLGVIDELLKMGVNLEEFSFIDLRDCHTYQDTSSAPLWNKRLIETMDVSTYVRSDGQKFTREEMLSFINFSTLSEFLTCIMNLTEVEYYVNFIEESVTMNPSEAVALPSFHTKNFSFISSDKLVSIKELCISFQKRLKQLALETEVKILERKLEELRISLEEKDNSNFDENKLRERIKWLYQEIEKITTEKRKELIAVLKEIIKNNNLADSLFDEEQQNQSSTFPKKEVPNKIEIQVQELGQRVESLEKRVSSLESILKNYLDHGGVVPNLENTNMSREEIIALIKDYKPTTIGAFFRKLELLKKLKVGILVALTSGMLFISGSTEKKLIEIENPPLTPAPTIDPVETSTPEPSFVIPPLPSKEVEASIPEVSTLRPVEEIVFEVIRGNWGDGKDRRDALEKEGYDFSYVQEFVNKVKQENVPITKLRPIEEVLLEVVNGNWGEDEEAEVRLTRVGFNYQVIQELISEMIVSSTNQVNPQK